MNSKRLPRLRSQPFQMEHLKLMTLRSFYEPIDGIKAKLEKLIGDPNVHAVTLGTVHRPVAVIGLTVTVPGVAEVWALTTDLVTIYPVSFTKLTKKIMAHYMSALKLRRLQMNVLEGNAPAMRFSQALGFEQEGLMRKLGQDGSNYFLYARVN